MMFVGILVAAIMILYPLLLLWVRSGTNACFAALLVLAILAIIRKPAEFRPKEGGSAIYWYSAAMASLAVATLLSQIYHWNFKIGAYDGPSRFLASIPIFLFLRKIPTRYLTMIQYGFIAGAFVTIFVALSHPYPIAFWGPHYDYRIRVHFLDFIHFGELSFILGLMACLAINWDRKDPFIVVALKLVALIGGLNATLLSGERGVWLAIPPAAITWVALIGKRISRRAIAVTTLGFIVSVVGLYFLAPEVNLRIDQLATEIATLRTNPDSSSGKRLQIYRAAMHIFAENPVFGIGPDRFASEAARLAKEGQLTPEALRDAQAEVHNEILVHSAALGLFGLASMLLIYLVPLGLFVQAARSRDPIAQRSGVLGSCFVVSFIVFGLTVETFDLKMVATFYALTVAVFLAIAKNAANQAKRRQTSGKDDLLGQKGERLATSGVGA